MIALLSVYVKSASPLTKNELSSFERLPRSPHHYRALRNRTENLGFGSANTVNNSIRKNLFPESKYIVLIDILITDIIIQNNAPVSKTASKKRIFEKDTAARFTKKSPCGQGLSIMHSLISAAYLSGFFPKL